MGYGKTVIGTGSFEVASGIVGADTCLYLTPTDVLRTQVYAGVERALAVVGGSRPIRKILAGGRYVSAALAEKLALGVKTDPTRTPHETLSDREYEVMSRIASGKTVKEIADELSLSSKTISTYRSRILEKLDVKNSAEIVQYAIRNGLVI